MNLLYMNPGPVAAKVPVVDDLTRRMAGAYRSAETTGTRYRGYHQCTCGAISSNTDYVLTGGMQTNSLCVHYLAYHRGDVPAEELAAVAGLNAPLVDPSITELNGR